MSSRARASPRPTPIPLSPEMITPLLFLSASRLVVGEVTVSKSQQFPASVEQSASRLIRGLRSGSSSREAKWLRASEGGEPVSGAGGASILVHRASGWREG